jgi:hypothetical protein
MEPNPPKIRSSDRPASAWDDRLTLVVGALLLYGGISGLAIWLLPFTVFSQLNVLVHTLVGLLSMPAILLYGWHHWRSHRRGSLSHYQLLGYGTMAVLFICLGSGLVLTWQAALGPRIGTVWQAIHLGSGVGFMVLVGLHIGVILVHRRAHARPPLMRARRRYFRISVAGTAGLLLLTGVWAAMYSDPDIRGEFVEDYDWRFGPDQPYLPSLARLADDDLVERTRRQVSAVLSDAERDLFLAALRELEGGPAGPGGITFTEAGAGHAGAQGMAERIRQALGPLTLSHDERRQIDILLAEATREVRENHAVDPRALAGSQRCGTCHQQIYREWLPSAHRYASLDVAFQAVQELTAQEVNPASTRYCAGCHDPISLFAGAKNPQDITLSAEGFDEGVSCVACHSITSVDVRGNADYTLELQPRYAYELHDGSLAKATSDFLIRAYPRQHVEAFSRPLYRSAEYCGACHKQFVDEMLNHDIGVVQAQNQYDDWRGSHWHDPEDPTKNVSCRECHMPLTDSDDPSAGDLFAFDFNRSPSDGKHREHSFPGGNQVIPVLQGLEGGEEHVQYVEEWLRGEVEIPEIAERWTTGPAVELRLEAPDRVRNGETFQVQVIALNNKVGHGFPTGPLDVIQSWVELKVVSDDGTVLHHSGARDDTGRLVDPLILYHSDPYDRTGERLWRHELWNLVGARYKRALFPGQNDVATATVGFGESGKSSEGAENAPDPSSRTEIEVRAGAGSLTVTAVLWYRKFHPEILEQLLGPESGLEMPRAIMGRNLDPTTMEIPTTDVARASMLIQVEEP